MSNQLFIGATSTITAEGDRLKEKGPRDKAETMATWWSNEEKLSEKKFVGRLRLPRRLFDELAKNMPERQDTNFKKAISQRKRLAICMRYLASGADIGVIAESFGVGTTSARYAIDEGITMINKMLPFPELKEADLHGIVKDFDSMGGIKV